MAVLDKEKKLVSIDMNELSEQCHNERFCVICLRVRTDVPVEYNWCYQCAGGNMKSLQ